MAEAAYTHKVLTIKCCIDSYASTIKKNPTNIKVKSGSNDDYFANLMTKVRKKFKFLDNLDDSEWDMKIGGDIVEKGNGDKLKEILQRIPPVPVIQIVKTQISEDRYVITLHFGDQKFDYPLTGAPDDWNEDIYTDLVQTIRDKFNLQSEFALYEDCGGSHVDMDGMDDIADSFDETDDISKAMPDMVDSKGLNVLHLFIRQESQNANQFKIMVDDGSSFFEWIPPNAETDDEKEWESNYDALLNDIAKRYNFDKNDIELQQDQDGAAIDVEADDLSEIWQELRENDTTYVAVLSSNVTSFNNKSEHTTLNEIVRPETDDQKEKASVLTEQIVEMNVYHQLNIRIPNDGSVVKHKSGVNDNEFITFLLPQIVMENQQSSLVNKSRWIL
eukprot:214062_1